MVSRTIQKLKIHIPVFIHWSSEYNMFSTTQSLNEYEYLSDFQSINHNALVDFIIILVSNTNTNSSASSLCTCTLEPWSPHREQLQHWPSKQQAHARKSSFHFLHSVQVQCHLQIAQFAYTLSNCKKCLHLKAWQKVPSA